MTWLLLAAGGMAGALCRFHGARFVQARLQTPFPWGTFVVNITGCCLLGLLTGLFLHHPAWPVARLRLLLATGFCGAYTTFSSFAYESLQLWRSGQRAQALLNLWGQPLLGIAVAFCSLVLGGHL